MHAKLSPVAFVSVLIALLSYHPPLEAKTFRLYYLGGQSNMDGFGFASELPEALQQPVKGVLDPPRQRLAGWGRGRW